VLDEGIGEGIDEGIGEGIGEEISEEIEDTDRSMYLQAYVFTGRDSLMNYLSLGWGVVP
jgi:hypothetical protein